MSPCVFALQVHMHSNVVLTRAALTSLTDDNGEGLGSTLVVIHLILRSLEEGPLPCNPLFIVFNPHWRQLPIILPSERAATRK